MAHSSPRPSLFPLVHRPLGYRHRGYFHSQGTLRSPSPPPFSSSIPPSPLLLDPRRRTDLSLFLSFPFLSFRSHLQGAFALNPDIINDAHLDGDIDEEQNVNELSTDGKKRNSDEDEEFEKPVKTTDLGAML